MRETSERDKRETRERQERDKRETRERQKRDKRQQPFSNLIATLQ